MFGSEAFWGGQLQLHQAIAGEANGGVGARASARDGALGRAQGRRRAPPPACCGQQLRRARSNLDDPATTLALLKLDAVVGVKGFFEGDQHPASIGITCALCHSTVDDSFAPGIGRRLDGWANRDLDVGAIVALAPDLSPFTTLLGVDDEHRPQTVLQSWGPGNFDAELELDGKAFRPDGKPAATLLPPPSGSRA